MARIHTVLNLERIDTDIFRGPAVESMLLRTFGGQVAAQALVAATRSVDNPAQKVHSLHGYFTAPGDSTRPVIFHVERTSDGRSFASRQVKAVQDGRTLFVMQASFHRDGDRGVEHSDRLRTVPDPEDIVMNVEALWPTIPTLLKEWNDWDIRVVPESRYSHNPYTASQQVVWFKSKTPLPDDDTFHVCTLAYMSDMTLLQSALVPHRDEGVTVQEASLDHAMWFLRPFRADEWLLYDQVSPSAHGGRALTHGRIFNRAGDLVAVVTQEGLTRYVKPGGRAIPLSNKAGE